MKQTEFERVVASFAAFLRELAPLFGRKEAQRRSEQYLRGLLVQQTDRRNAENVAEAIEGATPRTLQRFLTEALWSSEAVIERLQRYLDHRLSAPADVFILDDTGFGKQGRKSLGVARQYSGTLGKAGNCQVGVLLGYASERGHALVDRALYLPRSWMDDAQRCQAAGVPADQSRYQCKTDLALKLLRRARQHGYLSGPWVTAGDDYGESPSFRDALAAEGWWYVLEVECTTQVFTREVKTDLRERLGNGRPHTKTRLPEGELGPVAVQTRATHLPDSTWQALTVTEGAQGPRTYQFASQRV